MTLMLFAMGLGITILLTVAWMLCWMAGSSDRAMDEILHRRFDDAQRPEGTYGE